MIVSGKLMGIKLENATWYEVGGEDGVDFRCELEAGYDTATVRKNIQVGMTKYLDFRFGSQDSVLSGITCWKS